VHLPTRAATIAAATIAVLSTVVMPPVASAAPDKAAPAASIPAAARSSISVKPDRKNVEVGGRVMLTTSLTPLPAGTSRTVVLWQSRNGKAWTQVYSVTATAADFALVWDAPTRRGNYRLRATSPAGSGFRSASSTPVLIRVTKAGSGEQFVMDVDRVVLLASSQSARLPGMVSLRTDVTADFNGIQYPRSVVLDFGPECTADFCSTGLEFGATSRKVSRFKATIVFTAPSGGVEVTTSAMTSSGAVLSDPIWVPAGVPTPIDVPMGSSASVHWIGITSPEIVGASLIIGSPTYS
jgi:hypothetical protein